MSNIIALDIGGTEIKYGLVTLEGRIIKKDSTPTAAHRGGEALMGKVQELIDQLMSQAGTPCAVGVSTAGQVDVLQGRVRFATDNLPGWTGMPIRERLEEAFGLPVWVENDVNAAALGEAWQGAGRGKKNFVMITLGTGIGGAIVNEGRICYGARGSAGEFGHIRLYRDGAPCTCGQRGCYEQYASTHALIEMCRVEAERSPDWVLAKLPVINGEAIFEAEKDGDEQAGRIIEEWLYHVAWGLASITHILNPDSIIIGGGVSRQGKPLMERIEQKLKGLIMPSFGEGLTVCEAELHNDAGLIGAAYGAWMYFLGR